MEDTNSEEESLRLAREGNPEFIYEKLYLPSTTKEIPSFKCWKCPTRYEMKHVDAFIYASKNTDSLCIFCFNFPQR